MHCLVWAAGHVAEVLLVVAGGTGRLDQGLLGDEVLLLLDLHCHQSRPDSPGASHTVTSLVTSSKAHLTHPEAPRLEIQMSRVHSVASGLI